MIAFPCPQCCKPLKVKDELAGKKVKCPACAAVLPVPGKVETLPAGAPRPAAADMATIAPTVDHPPAREATVPPPGPFEATRSPHPDASSPDASLTAFLAPPQAEDELGRLGGFRILKILGHGGMGVVFQGEDPRLGRQVAIKAMLPDLAESKSAQQRFLREACAAAALEHDHIVPILQVGEERGAPFIVMPFLQGEPLDRRLEREGRLPTVEVLRIGRQTALGLEAAHKKGLIHRDIKPANIWLEAETERIKILDFGLARPSAGESGLTQQGVIIGTPAYMAPEQGAGEKVDHRCDLFSLGCVLYRLCTGQMAFKGKDTVSTIVAVAMDNPKPPAEINPDVPVELSDLVMQLLAKKPDQRPESARMVAETLQEIEGQAGAIMSRPRTKSQPAKGGGTKRTEATRSYAGKLTKRRPRLPWLAAGGVLGLAVVGLLLFFLLRPSDKQASPGRQPEVGSPAAQQREVLAPAYTNSLGMEFVLVPKGKSWLGGGGGKPGDKEVEIEEDFYLSQYEVTQEEWEKVMGSKPSHFSRTGGGQETVKDIPDADLNRFPVENVSWEDALLFMEKLNKRDKQEGWVYRLPKEVEWEYACRGGPMADRFDSAYDFYFDKPANQLLRGQANFDNVLQRTCKVGSYKPNRLGLYDMNGNVFEWCEDQFDPKDPLKAADRVARGGGWNYDSGICRAARRGGLRPSFQGFDIGLRLARVPVGKEPVASPPPPEKKTEAPTAAFKNSFGMEFVLVPKGKSWLGGGAGRPGDREVDIAQDFYLGKHEVTQEEWEKVMGSNPSQCKTVPGVTKDDLKRFPVESVSWDDAQLFVRQLNQRDKQQGWVYRLPKEVEWEYACRGGPIDKLESRFDFYLEKPALQLQKDQANVAHGGELTRPCTVGSYKSNRLGLHDMHGNVWEWCDDEQRQPDGSLARVIRGGSCRSEPIISRASQRALYAPSMRISDVGLRVARVPAGKESK